MHKPEEKSIEVFGYSQGYGKADHSISVDILKKKYKDYKISWSDEGYWYIYSLKYSIMFPL